MTDFQKNMAKFYSKLEEFRATEKYTDVILECEGKSFKCHRLALASGCSYFDAMFGGKFKESNSEKVVLLEIDAVALEEVIRFIYTGNALITSDNVCSLVQASEFFKLPEIEAMSVQFIQTNPMMIESIFDIFAFACATKKTSLINMLSIRIVKQFGIFSNVTRFLEISFDELNIILNQWISLFVKSDESCLGAIDRWVSHNREERSRYSYELVKMITFENVSPSYLRYMFTRYYIESDVPVLYQGTKPISSEENLESQPLTLSAPESLHVFVKHRDENLIRIFSMNSPGDCFSSGAEISMTDYSQRLRSVASDNLYLYIFNYTRNLENVTFDQTFSAYTSINLSSKMELKPPPFNLKEVLMCSLQNKVYMYNEFSFLYPAVRRNCSNAEIFNEDEINRGIYVYNGEVDTWFPVAKMKKQLEESCLIGYNNILYLLGGTNVENKLTGYMQAYDYRIGEWQILPKSDLKYTAAACCAIDNRIYVCGGKQNLKQAVRYDLIAGKWESITEMNKEMNYHSVLPFSDHLWVMNSFDPQENPVNDLSIEIYDLKSQNWRTSSILLEAAGKIADIDVSCFVDAVVF